MSLSSFDRRNITLDTTTLFRQLYRDYLRQTAHKFNPTPTKPIETISRTNSAQKMTMYLRKEKDQSRKLEEIGNISDWNKINSKQQKRNTLTMCSSRSGPHLERLLLTNRKPFSLQTTNYKSLQLSIKNSHIITPNHQCKELNLKSDILCKKQVNETSLKGKRLKLLQKRSKLMKASKQNYQQLKHRTNGNNNWRVRFHTKQTKNNEPISQKSLISLTDNFKFQ